MGAIESGWRPGLIGDIVRLHAVYYAREWGFGAPFEATVAGDLAGLFARFDPARDAVFHASAADGALLATVSVDGSAPGMGADEARVRFFIAADAARGTGLGARLLDTALAFVDGAGVANTWLTTFEGLDAARRLYEARGFALTRAGTAETWGRTMVEQRFDRPRP